MYKYTHAIAYFVFLITAFGLGYTVAWHPAYFDVEGKEFYPLFLFLWVILVAACGVMWFVERNEGKLSIGDEHEAIPVDTFVKELGRRSGSYRVDAIRKRHHHLPRQLTPAEAAAIVGSLSHDDRKQALLLLAPRIRADLSLDKLAGNMWDDDWIQVLDAIEKHR